jgi:hypothetical protein
MFLYAELSCLIQTVAAGFVVHLIEIPRAVSVKTDPAFPNTTFFLLSGLQNWPFTEEIKTKKEPKYNCQL